jgi:hypothetical protein
MIRRLAVLTLAVFTSSLLIAGCQKSADQTASDQTASTGANAMSDAKTAKNSRAAVPAAPPVVVPAGTTISVVLDETISTKTATDGQTFSATVSAPIAVGDKVVIPKHSAATGVVREAKSAGRFKGGAVLGLTLTSLTVDGRTYDIDTSRPIMTSKGRGKRSAEMIGGGGAGGAIIGALAGGGKGAAIGAAIGAAAGTGGAAFTGKREITLPAETGLNFKLLQPLELKR